MWHVSRRIAEGLSVTSHTHVYDISHRIAEGLCVTHVTQDSRRSDCDKSYTCV